jgi:hypothetical protein
MESLRGKTKAAFYGVVQVSNFEEKPYQNYTCKSVFSVRLINVDSLSEAVFVEIEKIKNNGVSIEDINKVKRNSET